MGLEKVSAICLEIAAICCELAPEWARVFMRFADRVENYEWNVVKREIMSVFRGGMLSFNDLVLQKDGVVYSKETNQLDLHRTKLYNSVADNW